jgi:two-component system sensor histidine kinase KdpD
VSQRQQDPNESNWARPGLAALVSGVAAPLAAAALALVTVALGVVSAVAVFMLAVTVAAVSGGLWGGVLAAVGSSIALPIILDPEHRLVFDETRDLVAAVVFLSIAVVVGLVVGNATDERARATRREREARLLGYLSGKLLSGEVPDQVLDDFAAIVLEPFGLATCHIAVVLDGTEIVARSARDGVEVGGPTEIVPMVVGTVPFGTLIAERPRGERAMTRDERQLLEAATRQAAAALDRARLDARARLAQLDAETNQLRAAMFSSVTHDLRTPLASIKAGVTSLLDRSVTHGPEQQRELLQTVLEETDRLNRLVGNIMDLARIRAGALTPRRIPTAIDEIVEAAVARLRPLFVGVDLKLYVAPDLPEAAVDPVQIDQVVTNVLENAATHSPPQGEVRVHVTSSGGGIRVRVSDQGPGIPLDERERIFEAFFRGQEAPERAGSGLGLAISRAIVVAHGGRIWVEETTGGGTAMIFEVPLLEGDGEVSV